MAGLMVAILATLIAIWVILFLRRRRTATTNISLEPRSEVSNQRSDLYTITGSQHTDDTASIRNEAYMINSDYIQESRNMSRVTNAAAIAVSQNEAYGTLQLDDKEHDLDSKTQPPVDYDYDYVDSETGRL